MKMKRIAIAAVVVLGLASLGGAALAKTPTQNAPPATSSETTTGTENETGGESTDASDGPGGHADPAGNVDHQFEGQE